MSVSGDTAVVGAYGADVGGNADQGAAYVFYRDQGGRRRLGPGRQADRRRRRGGGWLWRHPCRSAATRPSSGAGEADVGGNADQGAAYVFYRDQGGADAWGQVAKLTAADGAVEDVFGYSVSVSGDTAVVGASAPTSAAT